ncbi:hypothetical protein HYPSUDRAFT_205930 [Hypholoma sublateritium FD-334 SS-4]|uniref:Uncharacterized protein n=1 Tax=Hypholoma sublateritium (strain FD-334 SS-4) TaxID=945553 RepID=A0A0D2KSV0_HYPSF|nr:hypothetical protein HYPSUDRAFT_205930 [Hypholoma sublateritium FD-334 SS-4]
MFPAPPNFSAAVHPMPSFGFGPASPFSNAANVPQAQFLSQDPLHQGGDPNSPELFKSNVQLLQQQVLDLQEFARRVLAKIQNAYQTGSSPATTEADIATLKQMLGLVTETMRQSGVGALPVLHGAMSGATAVPSEAQLLAGTTQNLRTVYNRLQRAQDSAAVAANLLAMDHAPVRVVSQAAQK